VLWQHWWKHNPTLQEASGGAGGGVPLCCSDEIGRSTTHPCRKQVPNCAAAPLVSHVLLRSCFALPPRGWHIAGPTSSGEQCCPGSHWWRMEGLPQPKHKSAFSTAWWCPPQAGTPMQWKFATTAWGRARKWGHLTPSWGCHPELKAFQVSTLTAQFSHAIFCSVSP